MTMDFLEALTKLKVNRRQGRFSPHKPVMMLAILDLAVAGKLADNRIRLDPALLTRYRDFWDAVAEEGDQPSPYLPYFHLRSEPFWRLQALPGQEATLLSMSTVASVAQLERTVSYAALTSQVYEYLGDPNHAEQAARLLIDHWFIDKRAAMAEVWERSRRISQYELELDREPAVLAQREPATLYEIPARTAGFRRLVLEAYDYRCAASGWRFMLDDWFLVEAAHIVPFSESHNDNRRNGIALSPTFHRLMDRGSSRRGRTINGTLLGASIGVFRITSGCWRSRGLI